MVVVAPWQLEISDVVLVHVEHFKEFIPLQIQNDHKLSLLHKLSLCESVTMLAVFHSFLKKRTIVTMLSRRDVCSLEDVVWSNLRGDHIVSFCKKKGPLGLCFWFSIETSTRSSTWSIKVVVFDGNFAPLYLGILDLVVLQSIFSRRCKLYSIIMVTNILRISSNYFTVPLDLKCLCTFFLLMVYLLCMYWYTGFVVPSRDCAVPIEEQLSAVDDLITSMDLSQAGT